MSARIGRLLTRTLLFLLLCALAPLSALPQSMTAGAIGGTIADSSHAVVAGAQITITSAATNQQYAAVSGPDGKFWIIPLPPGTYRVRVVAPTFAAAKAEAIVELGRVTEVSVTLRAQGVVDTIDVTAEPPVVNTQQQDFSPTTSTRPPSMKCPSTAAAGATSPC
jgi:hypothetical protein